MRKAIILLLMTMCATTCLHAQKYLDYLQTKQSGKGTVTVNESKEIDRLVNGVKNEPQKTVTQPANPNVKEPEKVVPKPQPQRDDAANRQIDSNNDLKADGMEIPVVDTRKKVMRGGYKVDGYRVQVFVGGNSRADKLKAQQAGNAVKAACPGQPVYVHFYSPRWICRVGNFRNYEDAKKVLRKVQSLGYKQAVIVKGKITIQ